MSDPQDPRYDWLYGEGRSGRPPGHGRDPDYAGANDPTRPIGQPPPHGSQDPYGRDPYGSDPYGSDPYGRDPYADPYGGPADRTRAMPQQGGYPPTHDPGYPPPGRDYPPPSGPPSYRPPRPRPRIRWLRIVLLALLAYIAFLVAVPLIAWGQVERVQYEPSDERPVDTTGTTYLVVGSDSREGLTEEQKKEYGTGSAGGRRTDTIMLLHVPDNGLPPALISLPRDSAVPIAGHEGKPRINSAFSWGGPKLLTQTVENATGLKVDQYVEIGFGGFVGMVDAVGGVDLCLDKPMKDEDAHVDLPGGCQTLKGTDALGYVRMRKQDRRGDLGRVERQQQFMAALAGKAMSPGTILNPFSYWSFNFATTSAIRVGENAGVFDMAKFAFAMRAVSGTDGQSLTVPIAESGNKVYWDKEEAKELFNALGAGKPIPSDLLPKKDKSSK